MSADGAPAGAAATLRVQVGDITHNTITVRWDPPILQTVTVVDAEDGDVREREAEGEATLGPLAAGTRHSICLNGRKVAEVPTQPGPLPAGFDMRGLIVPWHKNFEWVHEVEDDYLIAHPSIMKDPELIEKLFREAVYVLPHRDPGQLVTCPNPVNRYCIDLTRAGVNWKKSRRMRAGDLAQYRMTMDHDYRASFSAAQAVHEARTGSGWITKPLLDLMDYFRAQPPRADGVTHHSFELWRGDKLVAVSMGYRLGATWHDCTHAAVDRDKNSHAGTILTKAMGHLLQQSGYKLWYWGLVTPGTEYMAEYGKYGGADYPREKFVPLWRAHSKDTPSPPSPAVLLEADKGLVRHRRAVQIEGATA